MTREEARKAAEVMLAYANGAEIEDRFRCYRDEKDWRLIERPTFDFQTKEYRIKPKPKFDPKTLQPFDKVLVRDGKDLSWACDFFSFVCKGESAYPYECVTSHFSFAIPYNEDTKHLVGTTDEAPEFYRYWEE